MGNARRFFSRRREENNIGAINRNVTAQNNFSGFPIRQPTSYSTNTFLQTTGGILSGSIGFESQSLVIATGVLTLTSDTTKILQPKKIVYLSVESGTSDTLTSINVNTNELTGQSLILVGANATHTITISHDVSVTGKDRAILCPSNTSFTLSGDNAIELFYDSTNSKWVIIGNTGTGGGGVSYPLTPSVNVVGNVASGTTTIDLSASNAHSTTFTATGDSTLAFSNYPSSGNQIEWEVEITQDSTGGRTITMPSEVVEDPGIVTTADSTSVIVFRTNDGGTIVHVVSLLNASPSTLTGATKELDNLTTTALNTDLHMGTFDIDELDRIIFDETTGSSLGTGDVGITSDVSSMLNFNVPTGSSHIFKVNASGTASLQISENSILSQSLYPISSSSDTLGLSGSEWFTGHIKQITVGGAQKGVDNIGELKFVDNTITPSGNGIFYFDGTDVKVRTGSVTKNLSDISSTTGANQQLSNLSGTISVNKDLLPNQATGGNLGSSTAGSEWFNLFSRRVTFSASTSLGSSDYTFGRVASPLRVQYNVPTGAVHRFTINGTREMELTNTELILAGVNLDMENNSITDVDQLQITGTSGDTLRGFLSGGAGVLDITANENDSQVRIFARDGGGNLDELIDANASTGIVTFNQGTLGLGLDTNQPTLSRIGNDANLNVSSGSEINLQVAVGTVLNITSTDINIPTGKFLDITDNTSSATSGVSSLPSNPVGFAKVKIGGIERRIPFYAV